MNDIQSLIDRQLGFYCRLNYDNILRRLMVQEDESFYGLLSSSAVENFEQDPPIFACRFCETPGFEHILALANEDGQVAIQDTSKARTVTSLRGFQCHNNAVFDLAWTPMKLSFLTVSGDHTACLWDVGETTPKCVCIFSNHTRSIKTAVFRPDESHVFATGARDGHILIWDTRANRNPAQTVFKPDNCLMNCHSNFTPKTPNSHHKRTRLDNLRAISITGLVFQDDLTLISCGECDGNIKVWDLRKTYNSYKRMPLPKHSIPYCGSSNRNGYTNLIVDSARIRLYASCMDDVIYCYNTSSYNSVPEQTYVGHENSTFYIKSSLSPDGMYLVSGSSDKNAYIWNVKYPSPIARLVGHWAEVTCAAWCQKGDPKIVTCSDDARHKIWRIGPEFSIDSKDRAEKIVTVVNNTALDKTPVSLKRKMAANVSAKRLKESRVVRKTKRCLVDLMNDCKENETYKRPRLDIDESKLLQAGTKRHLEQSDQPSCSGYDINMLHTPTKRSCKSPKCSPLKESPIKASITPTKNLPNYVLTGDAPHLSLMSPVKKKRGATDWLTLIVREKKFKPGENTDKSEMVATLSPDCLSKRNQTIEKPVKAIKKTGTLLKYFNVSAKTQST